MKQLNSRNVSTNLQRQREANRKEEELEDGEGGEDADASLKEFPILE